LFPHFLMHNTLLDTLSSTGDHCVPLEQTDPGSAPAEQRDAQDICIGQYSVNDPGFIRRAASDLMQRCVLCECELPESVIAALALDESNQHAIGMANALLSMSDLRARRDAICLMIHAIVSLQ